LAAAALWAKGVVFIFGGDLGFKSLDLLGSDLQGGIQLLQLKGCLHARHTEPRQALR
jgi:hypothetical protein